MFLLDIGDVCHHTVTIGDVRIYWYVWLYHETIQCIADWRFAVLNNYIIIYTSRCHEVIIARTGSGKVMVGHG